MEYEYVLGLLDIPSEIWEVIFRHLPHAASHHITFLSKVSKTHLYTLFLTSKSPLRFVVRGSDLCDSLVCKYETHARRLEQAGAAPIIIDILATCHAEAVQAIQTLQRIALEAPPLSGLIMALYPFTNPDPVDDPDADNALARALPLLSTIHFFDLDLGYYFT